MVIKVRPQERMSSSLLSTIEGYFFWKFTKLRKLQLRQFLKGEQVAPFLKMEVKELRHHLVNSKKLHGIIMMDGSLLIHPDAVFSVLRKKGQAYIKKNAALLQSLQS